MHKIQKQFIREREKCSSSFLFSSKIFKAKNWILTVILTMVVLVNQNKFQCIW